MQEPGINRLNILRQWTCIVVQQLKCHTPVWNDWWAQTVHLAVCGSREQCSLKRQLGKWWKLKTDKQEAISCLPWRLLTKTGLNGVNVSCLCSSIGKLTPHHGLLKDMALLAGGILCKSCDTCSYINCSTYACSGLPPQCYTLTS